ncbi:prepilin-type N-terminal cleavage/methylation domain-containing protein [Microcoleus sp. FACHB-831]|nr:prepilin-type N-terminal cleavage/methylation domain-containing protein [Microcoleus sp. FACHB-831]
MLGLIKFILLGQLKRPKLAGKNSGFTLIEVLVAMILAVIVLVPLMGFAINMVDSDRKEQAKSTSDQEIQSALNYIAQDLQQAVYIYDGAGITAIKSQLPHATNTSQVPVLVFWKRDIQPNVIPIGSGTKCSSTPSKCDDAFVYSLVVYYLMDNGSTQNVWSKNAYSIGRVQINGSLTDAAGKDLVKASPGYKIFSLDGLGTLSDKMNKWQKSTDTNIDTNPTARLIDYVDKTTAGVPELTDCTKLFLPDSDPIVAATYTQQKLQTPSYTGTDAVDAKFQTRSFYACVDSNRNTARVFIRGNALVRFRDSPASKYNPNAAAYFPIASVQVQGRGALANNQ